MDDSDRHPELLLFTRGHLKTFALLLLIFGSALALLALASHRIILGSFDELERQNRRNQIDQFTALLNGELHQLGRTAGDYAGWDAAYAFVGDGNRAFIDNNLNDAIFSQLRLHLLLYVDSKGVVRYGKAFDPQNAKEIPLPPQIKALHDRPLLAHSLNDLGAAGGVVVLPEGLLLTVIHPVLKSDYTGPPVGSLIIGRFFDADEIERLEGILQAPIEFYRLDEANLPAEIREVLPHVRAGNQYTQLSGNDKIAAYALFSDFLGKEAYILKIGGARLYYQQGARSVELFLVWAATISCAAAVAIFVLIDRLKRGKERLRQAHNLLEGILISSEDLIVAVDAGFRYLLFNRAYAEEYRLLYGAEVRVGGSIADALVGAPQACEAEVALWERALGGEAFTRVNEAGLARRRRTFEMKFTPLYGEEGEVVAAACIARDMTLRLREERALRESEQRFRVFFNNVAVGAIQLNAKGQFLRVNDRFCAITGYSREELLQMTPEDLVHPDDRDPEAFRSFLLGEASTFRAELRAVRKDEEVVWIEIAAGLVRDESGSPVRTMAIAQEISARKRLEEELRAATRMAEAASRAKSEFLATMSHEIRTPMTVFMVALEHLLEIDRNSERRQFLEMADGAARRLRALIDDILDFSRIEAGRLEIDEQPFDLRECVSRVVDLLTVSARDKGLRLKMQMADGVPATIVGDPDRIEQVLINLVGNAIKFTDAGEIRVLVERADTSLRFAVRDTGIGIPEDKKDILFRHFSQVDSSMTRRYGGTGLGLAICKGLIDLMGGLIGFESHAGAGSDFYFTLPLKAAGTGEAPASGERPADNSLNNHPAARILLVEDEPTVRAMIQMLLHQNGWPAEIAENGEEALARWLAADFNLIFMDVQVPGMNGLETARQIRLHEKERGGHTCIIGLTAHADREMERNCLEAGMDSYIAKPVRMGELFAAVQRCFDADAARRRRPLALGE